MRRRGGPRAGVTASLVLKDDSCSRGRFEAPLGKLFGHGEASADKEAAVVLAPQDALKQTC